MEIEEPLVVVDVVVVEQVRHRYPFVGVNVTSGCVLELVVVVEQVRYRYPFIGVDVTSGCVLELVVVDAEPSVVSLSS